LGHNSNFGDTAHYGAVTGGAIMNQSHSTMPAAIHEDEFATVVTLIESARQRVYRAANTELIELYWQVGAYISRKIKAAEWGDGVIGALAKHLAITQPNLKGFTRSNLFRMRQFYETYQNDQIVAPLVRQLSWTHNLIILSQSMPPEHSEADLHQGLLTRLKHFLLELGRDYCFIGSEYPVQVGKQDFALDLLFFHRGLNALVAIELKVDKFQPEHLGKLNFYLEALDRDHKKPHENPAIGVLLCASKDDEVVEYALSRSLSPAMIAEYQTQLPDKELLQAKLHEFYLLNIAQGEGV
jgi:predicted nuclease of restriction endonuclease-like (RecB) superfamily